MQNFMDTDFLLTGSIARQLYHETAEDLPLFDYHYHLNAEAIALNSQFENLTHLLLVQDHYK